MKKRVISVTLAIILAMSVFTIAAAAAPSMSNFTKARAYSNGQFSDVSESAWYGTSQQRVIATAFEYSLMNGNSASTFNPTGNISVAESLAVAARVHSIYNGGDGVFSQGSPWFQVYVDYAQTNGLINAGDFTEYTRFATRAEMAYIFSRSIPAAQFASQNTVNSLPDVNAATPHSESILTLYRAGVLTGSDADGTFSPGNNINRAEAAAIISRVILPDTRTSGRTYGGSGYTGQVTDQQRTLKNSGPGLYTGYLVDGVAEDVNGKFVFDNGNIYIGGFKGDMLNGQGNYSYNSGHKYVGEFKDNMFNGQGTFTSASGDVYSGEWLDNTYNGQGTYTFTSGSKYIGEWKDGKYNGQGVLYNADGTINKQGYWKDGVYLGESIFTGQVTDQQRTLRNSSPGLYTGYLVDGVAEDENGKFVFENGNIYEGGFKDDMLNGQGTYTYARGDKYVGELKDNMFSGQGTFTSINGDVYSGGWLDNKYDGQGTYTFASGSKYVGEWKENKYNGQGVLYNADGTINKQGKWIDGVLVEGE